MNVVDAVCRCGRPFTWRPVTVMLCDPCSKQQTVAAPAAAAKLQASNAETRGWRQLWRKFSR